MTRLLASLLLAIATLSAPAIAERKTPSDQEIKARVEDELEDEDLDATIGVAVSGRVVTLTGTVPSAWAKRRAIAIAEDVRGVQAVVPELKIAAPESDAALAEEAARKVSTNLFYSIFDSVNVEAKGGVVTLSGHVVDSYTVRELVEAVKRVPGVQDVVNQVEILPPSGFDHQIRMEIASRIYNDPVMSRYAVQSQPPIHVIVKNGHVILSGVVDDGLARTKSELIAHGVPGVFSVKNQIRVEK
jgi:hyperosmotically inducible protein